ncbi:type I polyketide synthase [Pseudoalteromonas umbrosa]|uniref:type I polyketide synthase n=1 Tax=Pseudoalteromonas umbrosa TaxID=3048489 RepID=UPI0024C37761|nr:type I polyketide synthase [Pseudoalteromonas sp. B95]MDK1290492.1 SDR family NAD(P)-dependent oxidoreductase [Pseudoalteromonas sp. B95]
MSESNYSELDIAIVGMAGRFPDADNVDQLWQNVRDGHCSVKTFDDNSLKAAGVSDEDLAHPDYIKRGIPFAGMAQFDAAFFGYTPKEAAQLDPQQRVFLQTCWHALEHAGITTDTSNFTGVFAGCGVTAYLLQNLLGDSQQDITSLLALTNGNDKDSLATRISYELDLTGPAVTVQTACSTSLVAVHMACRSLQNYECDSALAGGVWLNLNNEQGYHAPTGGSLSPSGQLSAFGEQADGILIGSGSAAVVLKRVEDAIEAGDHILAVIKGSAINNDGKEKVGYTAPSVTGQASAIEAALEFADIEPSSVGYIETHGTGTTLGDPIEIAALSRAYGECDKQQIAIGSIKANIGHLDSAAGVTGLIKAVQALRHKTLPPSLHCEPLNSKIDFANSPFYVNTTLTPWESDSVRRAAVSSLGMGGTNAHVILEEYRENETQHSHTSPWHILPVSANSQSALESQRQALAIKLQQNPDDLALIAAQSQHNRTAQAVRHALVVDSAEQAQQLLVRDVVGDKAGAVQVALMFSGQGSQYVTMAKPLLEHMPEFKAQFDDVIALFDSTLQDELRRVFTPNDDELLAANQLLGQTRVTQLALFVVAYAMAKCYQAHGIHIEAMLGHSIGEYVAACLSEVMSLDTAVKLVTARGEALQKMAPGAMLSVMSDAPSLQPYLNAQLDIAACNSPTNTVVAGSKEAIKALQTELKAADISVTRLHVSHAFHSHLTEPVLDEFAEVLNTVQLNTPQTPFVSNVTGTWITPEQATSTQYWLDHIRQAVNFVDGVKTLAAKCNVLVEAGPGDTLQKLAKQSIADDITVLNSIAHARDLKAPIPPCVKTLAKLWQLGIAIDWSVVSSKPHGLEMAFPAYQFDSTEYWVDATLSTTPVKTQADSTGPELLAPVWQQQLNTTSALSQFNGEKVLVIATDAPILSQLTTELGTKDAEVIVAWQGDEFVSLGQGQYRLDCQDANQLTALYEQHSFTRIVDCRLLDESGCGYQQLLPLAKWLLGQGTLHWTVVACELFSVLGDEQISADKATALGITRVIGMEQTSIDCQLREITSAQRDSAQSHIAAQLVADMANEVKEIAYRGRQRFVLTEQVLPRTEVTATSASSPVTFITGGLGGVGLVLAELLAAQGHALMLQTRTEFPDSEQWPALLVDEHTDSKLTGQIHALQALQEAGARVAVVTADVLDIASLNVAISHAEQSLGRITQVIHAAGLPGGGMLAQMTTEQAAQSMAAKTRGTDNLLAAFKSHQLERMILCSSLASVLGALGQSDYCAANSYLDAVAMQSQPFLVQSVNWDAWANIGMAAGHSVGEDFGIDELAAKTLLDGISQSQAPQVYATSLSWQARADKVAELTEKLMQAKSAAPKGHKRPDLDTEFEAPESELELQLAAIWSEFLGFDEIGIFDNLFELGGDSLIAIQMLAKVKQQFAIEIEPATFFEDPNLDNLTFLIEEQLLSE